MLSGLKFHSWNKAYLYIYQQGNGNPQVTTRTTQKLSITVYYNDVIPATWCISIRANSYFKGKPPIPQ